MISVLGGIVSALLYSVADQRLELFPPGIYIIT
jgi:hypothetical protein